MDKCVWYWVGDGAIKENPEGGGRRSALRTRDSWRAVYGGGGRVLGSKWSGVGEVTQ